MFLNSVTLYVVLLLHFLCYTNPLNAQEAVLKHSYTFDDGTANDQEGEAHGTPTGGKFIDGMFVTSKQGEQIAFPGEKIQVNTYVGLTLEAYVIPSKDNKHKPSLSYFGGQHGSKGVDYLFQATSHEGFAKSTITCKNQETPWTTETLARGKPLESGKHHVVTTVNDQFLKMYLDGILVATMAIENPDNVIANLGNEHVMLCNNAYTGAATWLGAIDEFNIYEGVLNSEIIEKNAMQYLGSLGKKEDLVVTTRYKSEGFAIDTSTEFDVPATGEVTFFAEVIPSEINRNNRVDQMLAFSDGVLDGWDDFPAAIRFSVKSGYLDVYDVSGPVFEQAGRIAVEIGEVYHCWVVLDIPANSYTVYANRAGQDEPTLIWKDAKFRKEVDQLTHWNTAHVWKFEDDALQVTQVTQVSTVGDYPDGFSPYISTVNKFDLNEAAPAGAVVIENPRHGYQSNQLDLRKVVLTDQSTELYFRTKTRRNYWISIPEKTFIKPENGDDQLYLVEPVGIPLGGHYYGSAKGYVDYKLVFPPIDPATKSIDYGEANSGGNWFVYDIQINTEGIKPHALSGNWFSTRTGDWEFSLLNDKIIYDQAVWEYTDELGSKKGSIKLLNSNQELTLYYKIKGDQLYLGESKKNLHLLKKEARYSNVPQPTNPPAFKSPIFRQDTAIFSGYINGYSSRAGIATGTVYVDNVMTGSQESHLIKIREDGRFSVKIPMTYPQEVFVRAKAGNIRLFLEPGEEVFMLIDLRESDEPIAMGVNARLISEIMTENLDRNYRTTYRKEVSSNILDMSPEEFKTLCLNHRDTDLEKLASLYEQGKVSDRYFQVQRQSIRIRYLRDILHYNYTSSSEYRKKHNIPRKQRELPVSFELPVEAAFYDFLNEELLNDEEALLANAFSNFINATKYTKLLRNDGYSHIDVFNLEELYGRLPGMDKYDSLVAASKKYYTLAFKEKRTSFFAEHGGDQSKFFKAYYPVFNKLVRAELVEADKSDPKTVTLRSFISDMHASDTLSAEMKRIAEVLIAYYSDPLVTAVDDFKLRNQEKISEMYQEYDSHLKTARMFSRTRERNQNIREKLAVDRSMVSDLMAAQDVLNTVVDEMTPLEDEVIEAGLKHVQSPYIASYVRSANVQARILVEKNKLNGGFAANDVPETEADRVFEAIMRNYEGKVVYVDFWATWCGPCRSSMKRQKPMKEELKDKDVVFVYITNPSSPLRTYNNMIPTIKGEHYRVSDDEWHYLSDKFNITGIPHYAIVNKKGDVVDYNASRNPSVLMKRFEKLMEE